MRTIDSHDLRFGELAGPLAQGARFFDWELISTQVVAEEFGYAFEDIVAADEIPYAPVVAATSVERYPGFRDAVTVETTPLSVGESSVELRYEIVDGDGELLADARITHVTIARDGGAKPLPKDTREAFETARRDTDPEVGPHGRDEGADALPSYTESFDIRAPHLEGSALAYFEEYPRFAGVALERFLADGGVRLDAVSGERQPFRLRDWRWEFVSTVPHGSTLTVESDVRAVTEETVRIAHVLRSDGQASIEGVTEYGCFDRAGEPMSFTDEMLAPFGR